MTDLVPSIARTIPLTGWMATPNTDIAPVPMIWPAKQPTEQLDYSVNIGAWLVDGGNDVPTSITVTPLATVIGDVAVIPPLSYAYPLITCILAYGQGGTVYRFGFEVHTEQDRVLTFEVSIAVLDDLPNGTPPDAPPEPVTWPDAEG